VQYREISPPAELADSVWCFWEFAIAANTPPQQFSIVPDGSISITYCRLGHGPELLRITGPRLDALKIPILPGNRYWGLRLKPYAGALSLGLSSAQLRDQVVDASEILPAFTGHALRELTPCKTAEEAANAFWQSFRATAVLSREPDRALIKALEYLIAADGSAKMADLAEVCELSERQLQRRFLAGTGLTPKQFARIRRLRSSIVSLRKTPGRGATLAADKGYTDQSHLIKECREIMQATPEAIKQDVSRIEYGHFD
jgi:AraC-like DNA-binding protein